MNNTTRISPKSNLSLLIYTISFLFLSFLFTTVASAATYYVDSSITDTNVGSATADCTNYNPATYACSGGTSSAYKTLTDVNAKTFSPGDSILFKSGDTFYGTLDPKGSGTSGGRITYGSYGSGEKPIITGFTTISGWTDEGNGIYSKVITSSKLTNMVLLDGVEQTMGRYPNVGQHLTYESYSTNVSITDNELTGTPNWTNAEMVITKNGWEIDRSLITNHTGNTINYTDYVWNNTPDLLTETSHGLYFIQNDIRTLDQLGEWYHDVNTGKFYMYFGGVDPNTKVVKVATVDSTLATFSGEDYLTIENLNFIGSIAQNINVGWQNDYLVIQNNDVDFSGTTGIQTSGVSTDINNNTINNVNGVGILPYGASPSIVGNTIINQGLIEGQGSLPYMYRGAINLFSATDPYVANNVIIGTGYDAIIIGSDVTNAIIRNNYIENSCVLRQDQGAIYSSGFVKPQVNLLIEGNIIVNSVGEGIYNDEYSTNVTVRNNTVVGSGRGGIFLHKANSVIVTGNNLYNNTQGFKMSNWNNENNLINNTITGNKVIAKSVGQLAMLYTTRYTDYLTALHTSNSDNNYYARPIDDNQTIQTNILAVTTNKTFSQWQTFSGLDQNSKKSPIAISSENDIFFQYNATTSSSIVSLPWPVVDMDGVKHTGNVTIPAYGSVIYLKDPNPADLTAPTISSFSIPSTSSSLSISGISLVASDGSGSGVSGYLLSESSTTPNPSSGSWSSTPQTTYDFSSAGNKTLYAFAKDIAGNVSLASSANISITLPIVTTSGGGSSSGGGGSSSTPTISTTPTTLIDKAKAKDIKIDGSINIIDFNIIMANWNKTYATTLSLSKGDITGDGKINLFDFNQLMVMWGVKY